MTVGLGLMTACAIAACGGGSATEPGGADFGLVAAGTGAAISASGVAASTSAGGAVAAAASGITVGVATAATGSGSSGTGNLGSGTMGSSMSPNTIVVDLAKIPPATNGTGLLQVKATAEEAPAGEGAFRTVCDFAHMSFDDPIVFPGQPGKSHLHTFFGNTRTDAGSTAESLRSTGNSTCRGGIANRSAYWVPTLIDTRDNRPIAADVISVYYKNGYIDGSAIKPIPVGLRMIAGDPNASAPHPDVFSTRWKCIGGPNDQNGLYQASIGNCDAGAFLYQEVFFPQCWDGVNLDSPDHKSHMSYPGQTNKCPATHPVVLPQISFNVLYKVNEKDEPLRWRLASDTYDRSKPGGYSSHGDWFNGWSNDVSDAFAKNCIAAKKDCHSHLLGDGRMIY